MSSKSASFQSSREKLDAFLKTFNKTVHDLGVNESKPTAENVFIFNAFALESSE